MEKFDLFMGCLGNGTTVCNKTIENNGNYKKVAHISEAGNIRWYQKPETIPGQALLRIEHCAHAAEENFRKKFDAMTQLQQYGYLLDHAPTSLVLEVYKLPTLEQKLEILKKEIFPKL